MNQTLIQKPVQSTPLVPNTKIKHVGMNFGVLSPIAQVSDMQSDWSENGPSVNHTETKDCMINLNSMPSYSVRDISTWIGGIFILLFFLILIGMLKVIRNHQITPLKVEVKVLIVLIVIKHKNLKYAKFIVIWMKF